LLKKNGFKTGAGEISKNTKKNSTLSPKSCLGNRHSSLMILF